VELQRVYDVDRALGAGRHVLVDRLWPRGVSKVDAAWDEWLKDVAPSTDLRRWYGHDVARFDEFRRRYVSELGRAPAAAALEDLASTTGPLTLLTATRDVEHSAARVVQQLLNQPGGTSTPAGSAGAGGGS